MRDASTYRWYKRNEPRWRRAAELAVRRQKKAEYEKEIAETTFEQICKDAGIEDNGV